MTNAVTRCAFANFGELVMFITMTILMGKIHEALRAADVPEGLAREAAEEAAGGYNTLEERLNALRLEMEKGFAAVRLETEKGSAVVRLEMEAVRLQMEKSLAALRLETEKSSSAVRQEIADLRHDFAVSRAETKGELRRLEWLLAGLIAIALAVATRYFLHG